MNAKKNILGIDLLKILVLAAIVTLHTNEFIFFKDEFPLEWDAPIWKTLSYYARVFALGGQILVSIIYFLFGYNNKAKLDLIKISLFCLLGQITLWGIFRELEWDIYSYILTMNFIISSHNFFFNRNKLLVVISLLLLSFTSSSVGELDLPEFLDSIILGKIHTQFTGPWPLMPWGFLAILFYQAGLFAKETNKLSLINCKEIIFWIILLLISAPFIGHYYWLPIGPHFYEYVFTQKSFHFWSNLTPFIFILRISFLNRVQQFFIKTNFTFKVSNLFWVRKLGVTYLISIIYLGAGTFYSDYFLENPKVFDLFFVSIMPISEIFSRILFNIRKRLNV